MIFRPPVCFVRQVSAGLQAFNLIKLADCSGRRVLGQPARSVAAALRNLPLELPDGDRLLRVETTHWRQAAFGQRTFNAGFRATNPRSRRSPPDPKLPDESLGL